MRILRFMGCESTQYGSMERYLVRFAEEARALGHDVVVAYDKTPASGSFSERLEDAGARFLPLEYVRGHPVRFWRELSRTIAENEIDVVHAYFTPGCHFALAYAWTMRLPVRVRTSANMPLTTRAQMRTLSPGYRRRFALRQRALSRFPQKILCLTDAMREEFLQLGVAPAKLRVVNGGVDETYFTPDDPEGRRRFRERLGVAPEEVLAGTAARLVPMKGLEHLVDAAVMLREQVPAARVVIAGDGPSRDALRERIAARGLEGVVTLAGHVMESRDLMAGLDVFVLPSLSEGLSNSLMEAMASGKPCVVTDVGPNATLVRDGETGILVPVRDAQALADAIGLLAGDAPLRNRLGAGGRSLIEAHYNVGRRVREELETYMELMG